MEQDWAKEPWTKDEDGLIWGVGRSSVDTINDDSSIDRIVACVNACAGIPTDILNAVPQGKACLNPMWYVEKEPPDAD